MTMRTRSVRKPRSASKPSAFVLIKDRSIDSNYDIVLSSTSYDTQNLSNFDDFFLLLYSNKYALLIISELVFFMRQAGFACLRCAAGGHFMSAGGSLRPRNYSN